MTADQIALLVAGAVIGAALVLAVDAAIIRRAKARAGDAYREGYDLGWQHGRWHDTEEYRKPLAWLRRGQLN